MKEEILFADKSTHLYHKEKFLPDQLAEQAVTIMQKTRFTASKHLKERVGIDKSHEFTIEKIYEAIENAKAVNTKPFEIGTNNGLLSKFVIRTQYDASRDISIVFYCSIKKIWTAWLNDSNDLHTTLDESKYADKSKWESECKFHYDNDV